LFDASHLKMNFVYVIKCNNGKYYTGITNNLKKRTTEHCLGKGSLFTKSHLPVKLVYFENFLSRYDAAQREKVIKDMSQKKKLALIKKFTSSDSEMRK